MASRERFASLYGGKGWAVAEIQPSSMLRFQRRSQGTHITAMLSWTDPGFNTRLDREEVVKINILEALTESRIQ